VTQVSPARGRSHAVPGRRLASSIPPPLGRTMGGRPGSSSNAKASRRRRSEIVKSTSTRPGDASQRVVPAAIGATPRGPPAECIDSRQALPVVAVLVGLVPCGLIGLCGGELLLGARPRRVVVQRRMLACCRVSTRDGERHDDERHEDDCDDDPRGHASQRTAGEGSSRRCRDRPRNPRVHPWRRSRVAPGDASRRRPRRRA